MRLRIGVKANAMVVALILITAILLFGCIQQPAEERMQQTASAVASVSGTQQASLIAGASAALLCSGTEEGFKLTCAESPPAGCENKNLGERVDCKYPFACFASKCAQATPSPTPSFTSPSPQTSVASGRITIHIKNFAFDPAEVTIKKGTEVIWVNDDSVSHTVTSDGSGGFAFPDSATLSWNQHYSNVFTNPGTYKYYCSPHPSMRGKIIVVE